MKTFRFNINTPEKVYLAAQVEMVKLTLADGEYVLLAGHEPVTVALDFGVLTYRSDAGETHEILCADGFLEMRPDRAVIFTRECMDADLLDRAEEKAEMEKMIARQKFEQSLITHHSNSILLARAIERKGKKHSRY